jgi:hypothetical protein
MEVREIHGNEISSMTLGERMGWVEQPLGSLLDPMGVWVGAGTQGEEGGVQTGG